MVYGYDFMSFEEIMTILSDDNCGKTHNIYSFLKNLKNSKFSGYERREIYTQAKIAIKKYKEATEPYGPGEDNCYHPFELEYDSWEHGC